MTPETRAYIQGHASGIANCIQGMEYRAQVDEAHLPTQAFVSAVMLPYTILEYRNARVPEATIEIIHKYLRLV